MQALERMGGRLVAMIYELVKTKEQLSLYPAIASRTNAIRPLTKFVVYPNTAHIVDQLTGLTSLKMMWTGAPVPFRTFPKLKRLHMRTIPSTWDPQWFGGDNLLQLERFVASRSRNLNPMEELDRVEEMTMLSSVLVQLTHITSLWANPCDGLRHLTNLTTLQLHEHFVDRLNDDHIIGLTKLQTLEATGPAVSCGVLSTLTNLTTLKFVLPQKLDSLYLPNVTHLALSFARVNDSFIENFTNLQKLSLVNVTNFTGYSLSRFTNLTALCLNSKSFEPKNFDSENFPQLKSLGIRKTKVHPLMFKNLSGLTELILLKCKSPTTPMTNQDLSHLTQLRTLSIHKSKKGLEVNPRELSQFMPNVEILRDPNLLTTTGQ